jgi:UDP-3-O-[3-hydroxymyristoyl] glucosamine N-acyltransferase
MDLHFPTTAAALGRHFEAAVIGNADAEIHTLAALNEAGSGALSFYSSRKYREALDQIKNAVLFTRSELVRPELPLTYLVVENPQVAFAEVARVYAARSAPRGISPLATVSPSAELAPDVSVGPFAVIEENAIIGPGTAIMAYAYVGAGVIIGRDCWIYPRVTLLERVRLGDRVKIFPGSVLGSEGFGFIREGVEFSEMPQIGMVIVEDNVRIGANCTIDRGTLGETRIGEGTKLDDQVHLGHNVQVGRHCCLCAQVGIGGSSVLEDEVMLGGQVGIGDHVRVGARARMGGQSGSGNNVVGGQDYFGTPPLPVKQSIRADILKGELPNFAKRVRRLENAVTSLQQSLSSIQEKR